MRVDMATTKVSITGPFQYTLVFEKVFISEIDVSSGSYVVYRLINAPREMLLTLVVGTPKALPLLFRMVEVVGDVQLDSSTELRVRMADDFDTVVIEGVQQREWPRLQSCSLLSPLTSCRSECTGLGLDDLPPMLSVCDPSIWLLSF